MTRHGLRRVISDPNETAKQNTKRHSCCECERRARVRRLGESKKRWKFDLCVAWNGGRQAAGNEMTEEERSLGGNTRHRAKVMRCVGRRGI